MNVRLTITLAAVVAVLSVAVWLSGAGAPSAPSATPPSQDKGPTIISAGINDITEINVQADAQAVSVRRSAADAWTFTTGESQPAEPANVSRMRSVVQRLGGLKAQSTITEQPDAAALREYGLDKPPTRITVRTIAGDTVLSVGAENARKTGKYVQVDGGSPVYLIDTFLLDDLRALATNPPQQPTPTATPVPTVTPTP